MDPNNAIPDSRVMDTQEFFENQSQTNALNAKRTFDEFQDLALTSARRSQSEFDKLNNIAVQALQNAVTTADMVAKQAVKHADVAADALWTDELNPVTRGAGNAITGATGVAADGVAATIPASADIRIVETLAQFGVQVAAQTAMLQQLVSVLSANTAKA